MYLMEEVGELATAIREESPENVAAEFADVIAWTMSLAALEGVDLEAAFKRLNIAFVGGVMRFPVHVRQSLSQ